MCLVTSVLHIKILSAELSSSPLDTLSLKIWAWDWYVDKREGNRVWEKLQYESTLYQKVRNSESFLFNSPAAGKIVKSDFTSCLTWKATMTQIYEKPSFINSRAQYFWKKVLPESEQKILLLYFDKMVVQTLSCFVYTFFPQWCQKMFKMYNWGLIHSGIYVAVVPTEQQTSAPKKWAVTEKSRWSLNLMSKFRMKGIFTSLNSCNDLEILARGKVTPDRRERSQCWCSRWGAYLSALVP